ncbi:hypothetical protein [Pseudooceanicola sp. 200-1SW]|uniref:hypothetical protein n=1 Tax=Pseudooceanicola sp. 200-1SW TaxID=3425949 RepID=UPI003D7F70C6
MTETQTLRVMPREMRLMSERIWSLTDLPKGFALMITDVVMYSQALGLGGFPLFEARLPALMPANPHRLKLMSDTGEALALDAGGQHAWITLPSVLDLAELALAQQDSARITVTDVTDPEELAVASALGARRGLKMELAGNVLTATRIPAADPVLAQVLQDGCTIEAAQWWRIYELAQTALTPDSVVSRRHAGVNIVTEDGQIIGRTDNDDDTDPNFINSIGLKTQEATQ